MRRLRLPVYATAQEAAQLRSRARAHKVSVSRYLLMTGLGEVPVPQAAKEAEQWWRARSPQRRNSIYANHSSTRPAADAAPADLEPLPFG